MQSKVSALLVLFFVIGIAIIPQSYAEEYRVSTSGCGIIPGIWNEADKTCTLNNNLVIFDVSNDKLIVDPLTKLVIPSGFELTSEGGQIKIDGTLENYGIIINNSGDIEVVGTFDNFFMYENNGGMDVAGIFTNNNFDSTTTEFTNSETVNITGTFNNLGTLQNTNGIFIFDTFDPPGTLINSGEITNTSLWHVSGLFTNSGSFTQDGFMPVLISGKIENYGSFSSLSAAEADISGIITIKSGSTFTNNGIMSVFPSGKIIIESTLDNTGEINNQCGLISNAVTTNQPSDKCSPKVIIITPINNKKYGNQLPVELNGTATDKNNLGVEEDITSSLMWTIKQGSNIELPGTGSPVNHIFSNLGQNTVIASVVDSGGNLDSISIDVEIVSDNDSDGFVDSEDCNDNDLFVYLGAPEKINGIDDSCDGTLSPDEVDSDSDGYILGLFTSSIWLGTPVPTGGNDCNDADKLINPAATEIFGDLIDNNCDGIVDEGFTDADSDGYVSETENVLAGFSDCNDTNELINPAATEIFDQVDNNCDGIVDEGFTDADSDGYLSELMGGNDCNDADKLINPAAPERINGIDDSCDGTLSPDEVDSDSDGYILGLFTSSIWLGTPVPTGGNDCDDLHFTVNPGASEMSVIDGVDTDCNSVTNNLSEVDADSDGYILGLFTSSIWLGTPVPTGGNDCRDNNSNVNPGATEIANGIDDDCDGTIDLGLDNDGDGYKTGNVIGISDCHDSVVTDPENQYFGIVPATVNPGVLEIFGDGFDNNCNDFIDEAIIFASDDLYNVDVDSILSISAPGVLENDTYSGIDPLFTIQQSSPIGILDFHLDGSFTYTPQTLLFDSDSFSYVASDGISESNIATVTLTQKFCGKDKDEFDNIIIGTTLHDHLLGTNGNDLILGLDGNDKIIGLKGNDCIYGGNGNDKINGNNGMDEIHGGNGNDLITGNNDNDKLFGDGGKDKIQGNNGDDFIDGGENSDYCKGGNGSNTIINCEKDDDHDDSDDDNIWYTAKGRFNHK